MTATAQRVVSTIGAVLAVIMMTSTSGFTQNAPTKAPAKKAAPAPVKLPAAVQAAFTKAYPQATIKHVTHETEDGQEQYEIESVDRGHALDVNYTPNGTVLVVEEEVPASAVPAAVMTALTTRYPKAIVTRREHATQTHTQYYELGLKGAPVTEVQLTPEGQWISPKAGK